MPAAGSEPQVFEQSRSLAPEGLGNLPNQLHSGSPLAGEDERECRLGAAGTFGELAVTNRGQQFTHRDWCGGGGGGGGRGTHKRECNTGGNRESKSSSPPVSHKPSKKLVWGIDMPLTGGV